jgi:aspartate/tyrosine/aromatic aminotransferase
VASPIDVKHLLNTSQDAILGITEAFKADSNPKKINLGPSCLL